MNHLKQNRNKKSDVLLWNLKTKKIDEKKINKVKWLMRHKKLIKMKK